MFPSRARFDAQNCTNDVGKLGEELSRDVSKQSALEPGHETDARFQTQTIEVSEHRALVDPHQDEQAHSIAH